MPTPKIQLAVQGGGAKVFALLAALDAVQDLVRQDKVRVTRIAGTSAGAVAASLFAAGINLGQLRHELEHLASRVTTDLQKPNLFNLFRLICFGTPFWSSSGFGKTLDKIFGRVGATHIRDTKRLTGIELFIVSADLNQSRRVLHTEDEFITSAVLDSCGIPFCFRTWRGTNSNRVDGGICENLPVEDLVNDAREYGPVVGISFERVRPKEPSDIRQFAMAILDAAIDNSVNRSIQKLGDEHIFSIACPYGTFDFDAALSRGLGDGYDLIRAESKDFFATYLDPEEMRIGDPWQTGDLNNMLRIGEMYEKQHRGIPFKIRRSILDVTVNSLNDEREADIVETERSLQAIDQPVFCHAIALSSASHRPLIQKTQLLVFDEDSKQRVEAVSLYMKSPVRPELRYVLVCFVPPLLPGRGPYTLKTIDRVMDAMKPLRVPPHADELRVSPSRGQGDIGSVEMIMRVPDKYNAASLQNKDGQPWGERMTDWDLQDRLTPGFRSMGWKATNLASSKSWALDASLY
jgi:predicted acylesterase/phospholipase RssA